MTKKDSPSNQQGLEKVFLKTRTIIISSKVDEKLANSVISQALLLENDNPKLPIKILINSPGGEVTSGFAIFDTLNFISCPICTIVTGLAASMGSILSLCGEPGKILAMPNARIMIHQPMLGRAQGNVSDLEIQAEEMKKLRDSIISIYCNKTNKNYSTIKKDIERDNWMNPVEALKYGLIDKIIHTRSELDALLK